MAELNYKNAVSSIEEKFKEQEGNDVVVTIRKPPSYLSVFLKPEDGNENVIFICKTRSFKPDDTAAALKDTSALNVSLEKDDLSGQPLEVTIDEIENVNVSDLTGSLLISDEQALKDEKYVHAPISAKTASYICGYSNTLLKPEIPLWMLVDGTDFHKSVLLGCLRKDDFCSRSWITVDGKFDKDSLDVDNMLQKHCSYTALKKTEIHPCCEVSCTISALERVERDNNILVHAKWNKPSAEIPPHDAKLILEFKAVAGKPSSPLYILWQQLMLLQNYFELVKQWKSDPVPRKTSNIILPTSHGVFDIDDIELSLEERIIDALMGPKHWSTENTCKEPSFEDIISGIKKGVLPGIDLTGRLWMLLSESRTYEELEANTALLLQQAKKCINSKPFINQESKSKMAEILRFFLDNPYSSSMMKYEPLELLVEIGVENLKMYYVAVFDQFGLRENQLDVPYLSSFAEDNDTWIEKISSYLIWMSRIHSAGELISIAGSNVDCSPNMSEIIQRISVFFLEANSPVTSVQGLIDNPILKFVTPISSYCRKNTKNLDYERWSMSLTTEGIFQTVTNVFLRIPDNIFPEMDNLLDDKNITLSQTAVGLTMFSPDYKWYLACLTSIRTNVGK